MKQNKKMKNRNWIRGSAFLIIFLAIIMLAGLSYTILQGGGSSSTVGTEQIRLAATEITQYADIVSTAVNALRLRGCSDTEISMEDNFIFTGASYINALAAANKACHVFNEGGGKVNAKNPETGWQNPSISTDFGVFFTSQNNVSNVGTSAADLLFVIRNIRKEICQKINDQAKIGLTGTDPPQANILDTYGFTGTYNASPSNLTQTSIDGKTSFCFQDTGDSQYKYVRAVIVR
jgi:hypothetical protein